MKGKINELDMTIKGAKSARPANHTKSILIVFIDIVSTAIENKKSLVKCTTP